MKGQVPSTKVQVVYQLSRGGQLEHPHMIEVHYPSDQEGLCLRDVKKRLTTLRGKGMPDSFSWSYQRNYKSTFIWHDLSEDDEIRPLQGSGEFVLKASELIDGWQDKGEQHDEEYQSLSKRISRKSRAADSCITSAIRSTESKHFQLEGNTSSAHSGSFLLNDDVKKLSSDSSMNLNQQIMDSLSQSKSAPEACSIEQSDASSCETVPFDEFNERNNLNDNIIVKRSTISTFVAGKNSVSTPAMYYRSFPSEGDVSPPHEEVTAESGKVVAPTKLSHTKKAVSSFSFALASSAPEIPLQRKTCKRSTVQRAVFGTQNMKVPPVFSLEDVDRRIFGFLDGKSPPLDSLKDDEAVSIIGQKPSCLGVFRPRLMCSSGVDSLKAQSISRELEQPSSKSSSTARSIWALWRTGGKSKQTRNKSAPGKPGSMSMRKPSVSVVPVPSYPTLRPSPFRSISVSERSSQESNLTCDIWEDEGNSASAKLVKEIKSSSERSGKMSKVCAYEILENHALGGSGGSSCQVIDNKGFDLGCKDVGIIEEVIVPHSKREAADESVKLKSEMKTSRPVTPSTPVTCTQNISKAADSPHQAETVVQAGCIPSQPRMQEISNCTIMERTAARQTSAESVSTNADLGTSITRTVKAPQRKSGVAKDISATQVKTFPPGFHKGTNDTRLPTSRHTSKESTTQVSPTSLSINKHSGGTVKQSTVSTERSAIVSVPWSEVVPNPPKPKDFKSRDERLLTPGLTNLDWEKTLQEAVNNSLPPPGFKQILQECSQCGRTFKPDSLKVHMRGCHSLLSKASKAPSRAFTTAPHMLRSRVA